jgi:hypothetical protein
MGLFARFTCLRHDGTAKDFSRTVRDLLRSRNVVETPDPSTAERLLMIAPAGDGWLMVVDHVEGLSAAMDDADGLLAELSHTSGRMALDIIVADSDDLILVFFDGGVPQSQLVIDRRGMHGELEPWRRLLLAGRSVEDLGRAFAQRPTLIEQHFPALKPLFGIDLAAFGEISRLLSGHSLRKDAVLLRLKAVPAPGQVIGPPKLEVDDRRRQNYIVNRSFPKIPLGLVTNFPAFCFNSRGGGARGLHVRLTGSALDRGFIEIASAMLRRDHPTDVKLNRAIEVAPEITSAGVVLRFPELEVPDWVQPDLRTAMRVRGSLHDLMVYVDARGMKVGDGELMAEAHLVAPESAPVQTSYPVTVLPAMWRPLKGSNQPHMIHYVRALNDPARINALAVLRGGPDESGSALRRALETWRSLAAPGGAFTVAAATEPVGQHAFFWPADLAKPFKLDLNKKRQAKWDRLMADLPSVQGLRIASDPGIGSAGAPADYAQRFAARISLHYTSAAPHPRLPAYAARLGHVSLSLPASRAGEGALSSLMQTLASERMIGQAYVAAWAHEDQPKDTVYECAADIFVHQRAAHGWGTRYLRAVADRMWLGPEFTAMLPDRAALDRVAIVSSVGDTLVIERRPEATLRDLELCLEPMLASKADSQAFWDRFKPQPSQRS